MNRHNSGTCSNPSVVGLNLIFIFLKKFEHGGEYITTELLIAVKIYGPACGYGLAGGVVEVKLLILTISIIRSGCVMAVP